MLLVTKHAPSGLDDVGERYCFLRRHGDSIPHTVIHGSEGCGKYSLARAWLTECWGRENTRLRRRTLDVRMGNRGPLTINYFGSNVHFVLNLAMHVGGDRAILTAFVHDVCRSQNVAYTGQGRGAQKVVVLINADLLSKPAQSFLRRVMETHHQTCRFILCCRSLCQLQTALLSRCSLISMPVDRQHLSDVLHRICSAEGIDGGVVDAVVDEHGPNLRRCINRLDEMRYDLAPGRSVGNLVSTACHDADRSRACLYSLLQSVGRPTSVLRLLFDWFEARSTGAPSSLALLRWTCRVDAGLLNSMRPIVHLEAYVLTARSLLSRHSDATTMSECDSSDHGSGSLCHTVAGSISDDRRDSQPVQAPGDDLAPRSPAPTGSGQEHAGAGFPGHLSGVPNSQ